MSERAPWLQNAIDQFIADDKKDGDVITHDWLSWALEIPEPKTVDEARSVGFLRLDRVEEFRHYLLTERKIALQNVRGYGYRIVPPNEQAHLGVSIAVHGIRKGLDEANKYLENTRIESLTSDEAKTHTDAQIKISGLRSLMRRQKKDVLALFDQNKKQLTGSA